MKKMILALTLALAMALSLAACDSAPTDKRGNAHSVNPSSESGKLLASETESSEPPASETESSKLPASEPESADESLTSDLEDEKGYQSPEEAFEGYMTAWRTGDAAGLLNAQPLNYEASHFGGDDPALVLEGILSNHADAGIEVGLKEIVSIDLYGEEELSAILEYFHDDASGGFQALWDIDRVESIAEVSAVLTMKIGDEVDEEEESVICVNIGGNWYVYPRTNGYPSRMLYGLITQTTGPVE